MIYDKIYRDLEYDYLLAKQQFIKTMKEQNEAIYKKNVTLEQM